MYERTTTAVQVNGVHVADLPNQAYTVLKLQPSVYSVGAHSFLEPPVYKRFTVRAGKSYYVQIVHVTGSSSPGFGSKAQTLIHNEQLEEPPSSITNCSLLGPDAVAIPRDDPSRTGPPARADGTSLLAPPELSYEERRANIEECVALAWREGRAGKPLTPEEKAPLRGRSTVEFFRGGRPVVNRDDTPSMWLSAITPPGGYESSAISDRYVLCFLARGYSWPKPVPQSR